jgi:NADH-quinone oxidoreductase subunit E
MHALAGFYTLLLTRPHGRYVVQVCTDLPCALRGAEAFLPKVAERLGCAPGATSDDGMFTLETVMCLAACDRAPMMQVNLEYFEDLTEEKLDTLVAELRARAEGAPRAAPFGIGPPGLLARREGAAQPPTRQPEESGS